MEQRKTNPLLKNGIKYLWISLPLLFISPIIITTGLKALSQDSSYWILLLGILLAIIAIAIVVQGIRIILKALFKIKRT
ncbi:MAG: DUF6095 family protein [Bacteroidota bacterium]